MLEFARREDDAPVILGVSEAAMYMYRAAIDTLPRPDHPKFQSRADVILSGLRKLQVSLAEAACRSRSTPSVIMALSEARHCYDDVMASAAGAPGASLGKQLYVARRQAKLSAKEVAAGMGLPADLPDALEEGQTPTEDEATKVKEIIAALREVTDSAEGTEPHQAMPSINGWDESHAMNGADERAEAAAHP